MMKRPKGVLRDTQAQIDAGINGFGAQLLAESFADNPAKFGDATIGLIQKAHNGAPVFILISTQMPDIAQFKDWPE